MKCFHFAPLALLAISGLASANVFYADTFDVSNLNQEVIEDRLSMAGPLFNGWDRTYRQGDPWVEAYGYHNRMKKPGGFGQIKNKGAALSAGYDHVIAENFRLGLALNGGGSQLKTAPFADKNDANFYGVNLYSTWTGKKVNVIANLGYTHAKSDNDWGLAHFSDMKTKAINAGLRFETSFVAGGISFVPYYGVRFTHLSADDASGNIGVMKIDNVNIWQFPVGVNAGYEYTCGAGWKTRSMLDLSIIPTAGRRKAETQIGAFSSDMRFADSVQYRGKAGLQVSKGQHAFGLLYGVGFAAHGSVDQNVKVNYQFMY